MMTIKVESEVINQAVEKIEKAVATGVRITLLKADTQKKRGLVRLDSFNGKNLEIQTQIHVITDMENFSCAVNGKDFITVIKNLNKLGGSITLEFDIDKNLIKGVEIKNDKSAQIKLTVLDNYKSMEVSKVMPYCNITVKTSELIKAMDQGAYAFGSNANVAGVFFKVLNESLNIFTLDGNRGAKSMLEGVVVVENKEIEECSFYVDSIINNIRSILTDNDTKIYILDKWIYLQNSNNLALINRLVEESPYKAIETFYESKVVEANIETKKSDLITALNIATVTEDSRNLPLVMKLEDDKLYIQSVNGNTRMLLNAVMTGKIEPIAFSAEYLRKAIDSNYDENIIIRYVNSKQPLWIENKSDEGKSYSFICPVNYKNS
jgi:hypothetical protein